MRAAPRLDVDGRASNWRYVVPTQPAGVLVLDPTATWSRGGIPGPPLDAVVVPDLGAWVGRRRVAGGRREAERLMQELGARVAPNGWICVGFANPWYPVGPLARGSLALDGARRALSRAGMTVEATYVALPNHRHPALLVPADRAAELDHVLRHMLPTYLPPGVPLPGLARRVMAILRAVAVRAPHRLRARLLPGYLLVARRRS